MASPFRDPGITDGEKSHYRIRLTDSPTGNPVTAVVEHDGDCYISSLEVGSDEAFRAKVEQRIRRVHGRIEAESYQAASYYQGRMVSREEGYFLDTQHIQFGGKIAPFPPGVMPLLGGLTLLRGLDFRRGAKSKHDLWLAFSISWPLEAKVDKRMTITVPAGSMDVWQVNLRPSFSHINALLDKVVSSFLPPFTCHFEAAATHRLVQFTFPSGPLPWQPRAIIELVAQD
ncbi:hypothetical protein ACFVUS_28185 [Nocardia sp. NPDC058058]|uniref:hypothetical protein n=1 Tax=Nocardia sp. NPDC058058 TaxID=3346317 RepID=UPI0036D79E9E